MYKRQVFSFMAIVPILNSLFKIDTKSDEYIPMDIHKLDKDVLIRLGINFEQNVQNWHNRHERKHLSLIHIFPSKSRPTLDILYFAPALTVCFFSVPVFSSIIADL